MITFAEEKFADVWDEFRPLAYAHWLETMVPVTGDEFRPDVARYIQFNEIGFYRLYTARRDGVLVGDLGVYITTSMHTQKKIAREDSWYMAPAARAGRTALRFLAFVESELRNHGVTSVETTTPARAGSARLLEAYSYKHVANCYFKELDHV